jgi:hypothetical protein
VAEQRYKAVMAVITEGRTITQVARDLVVSRQARRPDGAVADREADPGVELHPSNTTVSATSRARPFTICVLLDVRTFESAETLRGHRLPEP